MFTLITWDHEDQLPLADLQAAMAEVFDPASGQLPSLAYFNDGSDSYNLIVSTAKLTPAEVEASGEAWLDSYFNGTPLPGTA